MCGGKPELYGINYRRMENLEKSPYKPLLYNSNSFNENASNLRQGFKILCKLRNTNNIAILPKKEDGERKWP